ncbi:MAG: DUF4386 family protein [Anaerolineales bacterium]|nr:DUF4386 family protein [Anaerolineales bacterium]
MKELKKFGGFAAFYLAAAYIIGLILFVVVLDYPSITDPAQKLTVLVENQLVIFSTNLLLYVFFGLFLVVLALALHDHLKSGAPALMQVATVVGIIWAGSLIASGMVSNAGIDLVVALYAKDPAQAMLTWETIETIASNGIGNGNGEILGGVWTLPGQPSCTALWRVDQSAEYPRPVDRSSGHHNPDARAKRPGWDFCNRTYHLVYLGGDRVVGYIQ